MIHKILVGFGLLMLLLMACEQGEKKPAISGTVSLCNNHNCGKVLAGNLEVVFKNAPHEVDSYSLENLLSRYERKDNVKWHLREWIQRKISDAQEGETRYIYPDFSVAINGELQIDTARLCLDCAILYKKFNIDLNTPPNVVNLRKEGFDSELQVKNAIAKQFGYHTYDAINLHSSKGKSVQYACDDACFALVTRGLTFKEAVQWAGNSYKWMLDTYTGASKLRERAQKDPDDMTDAEWYDYMESLSDDPKWKETVQKQRQEKGIE